MIEENVVIKCDICGKELTQNGYPYAWENIKRTHVQSYSTWEGYDTEEQICSACWAEAFGEKEHRKTIKDRIKEYDTAIKKCENLKDSLEQEKLKSDNLNDKMLKIKQLLALGILEFDNNTFKINTSECKKTGVCIELAENVMNMSFSDSLFGKPTDIYI